MSSHHHNTRHNDGYILLYVVLAITLFTGLVSTVVQSTVTEVELGAQELDAVKAQAAADAAMECFSYWMRKPNFPFNNNTPSIPFTCAVGDTTKSFTTPPNRSSDGRCLWNTESGSGANSQAFTYELSGFENGSCARVTVEVKPQYVEDIFPAPPPGNNNGGNTSKLCTVRIRTEGYSGACGEGTPSYARWETAGGWKGRELPLNGEEPDLHSQDATGESSSVSLAVHVEPYAVMHVEVSGTSSTRHVTSPIEIGVTYTGTPPTPLGEVVEITLVDATALTDEFTGHEVGDDLVKTEFKDADGDQLMEFNSTTTMRISIPGDTPVGFYRLAVRAEAQHTTGSYYTDEKVYLSVVRSGSGQGD